MNLKNMPWWGRLLLFVILGGAIIYLGYKVYPNFTEIEKQINAQEEERDRLRAECGTAGLPRTVNFITGPSRTADIEQTIQMGAHGPRRLCILLVDDDEPQD